MRTNVDYYTKNPKIKQTNILKIFIFEMTEDELPWDRRRVKKGKVDKINAGKWKMLNIMKNEKSVQLDKIVVMFKGRKSHY